MDTGANIQNDDAAQRDNSIKVYILYKSPVQDKYTSDIKHSHHILLLKTSDGQFYYMDLQTNSNNGEIETRFGKYEFLEITSENPCIHYKPVGHTKKSLRQIKNYADTRGASNSPYNLLIKTSQVYIRSAIIYLNLSYPGKEYLLKSTENPDEINLNIQFSVRNALEATPRNGILSTAFTLVKNLRKK